MHSIICDAEQNEERVEEKVIMKRQSEEGGVGERTVVVYTMSASKVGLN